MEFALSEEQRAVVATTRAFVERELYPHEQEVEQTGVLRRELAEEIAQKAIRAGLHAANMPEEVGGAGLDTVTWVLYEKELGKASYALHSTCVGRPSNILLAGTEAQKERYLYPTVRGERRDCLAMTEPDAGSDLRAMRTRATRDGDGWLLHGTKHFISHAQESDFVILFARTDPEEGSPGAAMSTFLVDLDTPGLTVHDGYRNVSHRGYTNAILDFDRCRVPADALLGEEGRGLELAGTWLGSTRLQVAANCLGRAERALDLAVHHAAERVQFGQRIGRFQGVSFKLADMAMELRAAELLTLEAAWRLDQGVSRDAEIAMAKLKATEVLAMVADEAIQVHGGMGLMEELPLERIWRDARIERIWDGTSEIQRHIISRALLRPLGA
jgi:acyl-CoA dehydrogenase